MVPCGVYHGYVGSSTVYLNPNHVLGIGYGDRELVLEAGAGSIKLQAEGSPAVVNRALAYGIDSRQAVATFRCTRLYSSTCVTCHSLSMRCHVALHMQPL